MSSAAAHALDVRDDADNLPGRPEPRLMADLPPDLDYRHYRTIAGTAGRYAVNIAGGAPQVYDLKDNCALRPSFGKGGRLRFRINYGPNKSARRIFLSRLVCHAAYGPPQYHKDFRTRHQAHHIDKDCTNDHASNLSWETPTQHARIERNRPRDTQPDKRMATQREGQLNSRIKSKKTQSKLKFKDVCAIIKRRHEGETVIVLAKDFRTTPTTIYRLIKGETRLRDVAHAYALNNLKPPQHTVDFVLSN